MLLLLLGLAHAQSEVLPVQRIRFYETGVAWIEREGEVSDTTTLPVPRSHLDDALKTLVVLGGDVEVDAITIPSALGGAHARALAGLKQEGPVGFANAMDALLGVEVQVETLDGSSAKGTLLNIEGPLPRAASENGDGSVQPPQYALTIHNNKGTLTRVLTQDISQVHSTDEHVADRLQHAASTLTQAAARQRNELNVALSVGGPLALGYLTEAPVWRATYRLVDPGDGQARLQAWGIVHNDTDEDWRNVQIELANGEPDSFLYPMAAPRYANRDLVTPEVPLSSVPQLATATPDAMWDDGGTEFGIGSLGGTGYGSGGGSLGVLRQDGIRASARLKDADPIQTPTQFVYRVANRLDLPARHSGLVPLIHGDVSAEPVVVFEPKSTRARLAVWLTNDTGKTLPAGVLSLLEVGGLGGESELDRLEPNASQMIQFGNELDIDLDWVRKQLPTETRTLSFAQGAIKVTSRTYQQVNVRIRNRSGRDRDVWYALALPHHDHIAGNWRTTVDRHTGWTYISLKATGGETTHSFNIQQDRTEHRQPQTITAQEYRAWAEAELADTALLNKAAGQRDRLATWQAEQAKLIQKKRAAESEVNALRIDLAAANGSDGTSALSRRISVVEQEIRHLGEEVDRVESRKAEAQEKLTETVDQL